MLDVVTVIAEVEVNCTNGMFWPRGNDGANRRVGCWRRLRFEPRTDETSIGSYARFSLVPKLPALPTSQMPTNAGEDNSKGKKGEKGLKME